MSFFDVLPSDEYVGFLLVERCRKSADHALVSYIYPSVDEPLRDVLMARLSFDEPLYSSHDGVWHYSFPISSGLTEAKNPTCTALVAIVLSKVYCPERFLPLAKVLADVYAASGSPPRVLEAWLAAFNRGAIPRALVGPAPAAGGAAPAAGAAWEASASDAGKVCRYPGLAALASALGVEAILVWTALLLKRRVAVFGGSVSEVVRAVRVVPQLLPHRMRVEVDKTGVTTGSAGVVSTDVGVRLLPVVTLNNPVSPVDTDTWARAQRGLVAQRALLLPASTSGDDGAASASATATDASSSSRGAIVSYIGGFTDPAIAVRQDLWDVCIDLTSGAVAVADHAKAEFTMTPVHKDVAKALAATLATAEDGALTDAAVSGALASKTTTILDRLRGWFPEGVTLNAGGLASFKERMEAEGVSAAIERFYWGVVQAELVRTAVPGAKKAAAAAAAAAGAAADAPAADAAAVASA